MKVMTVLGTRPEVIRLNLIIKKLDRYFQHVLVHTGQNFADGLNAVFFDDFQLRAPDYDLSVRHNNFGKQVGEILAKAETIIADEEPDKLLILGDTNSGLVSIVAQRMRIPVYHMEAGNRCFDDRVPEEINRRIIDHSSDILMPYTHRSKENLLREGIGIEKIYVIGNPIFEVINAYDNSIKRSDILEKLKLNSSDYFLVTVHRAENVDILERLQNVLVSLDMIGQKYELPIICSLHPRTKSKITKYGLNCPSKHVTFIEPVGFFDFLKLEQHARCVISDSGTVQEECCILRKPNVTIRDVTERPETIECGSNILAGVSPDRVIQSIELALDREPEWQPPVEYLERNVSSKVVQIIASQNESEITVR